LACETQHMCSEKRKSNQEGVEERGQRSGRRTSESERSVAVNLVGDLSPGESGHFLRGLGNRKWVKNRKTIGEANEGHKPTGK